MHLLSELNMSNVEWLYASTIVTSDPKWKLVYPKALSQHCRPSPCTAVVQRDKYTHFRCSYRARPKPERNYHRLGLIKSAWLSSFMEIDQHVRRASPVTIY